MTDDDQQCGRVMSNGDPLRVFISYSHDGRPHAARVAALSDRLRSDGIDCHIDQYYVRPSEGWPVWMRRQVEAAETILVVCTETYRGRFDRKNPPTIGRGVRWESLLVENEIYLAGSVNEKFLPLLFDQDDQQHIPTVLGGFEYAHVDPNNLDANPGYEKLLQQIRHEPPVPMPPLGGARRGTQPMARPLPTLTVQESFFQPDEILVETHRLPMTGAELFGRDEQLARLDAAWVDVHTHVISFVAFGDVGKSALVNHWLARMARDDYRGARRVFGWSAYS